MPLTRHGKRTVVFFGAGASKPFGYPLTEDILGRIWEGLHVSKGKAAWKKWANFQNRPSEARWLREFLCDILPGLEQQHAITAGTSIIDVLSMVDQLSLDRVSPHPSRRETDLRRAQLLLNMSINGVLQGKKARGIARRFTRWMLERSVAPTQARVTLISTNYDTVYESALYRELIERSASVGRLVDMGIVWRDAFRPMLHLRPQDARLAVFKLHGSLNWLRCEVCGHITVNVRKRIAAVGDWRTTANLPYNHCDCGGRLRTVLVTPSIVRDIREPNLLTLWNAALEDLRMANEWIIVGYSLPAEDTAIRSLLLRALHSKGRRRRLRVRVVQYESPDPDLSLPTNGEKRKEPSAVFQRYRMFFPEKTLADSDYSREGVAAFVDQLELSPPKTVEAALRKELGLKRRLPGTRRERELKGLTR